MNFVKRLAYSVSRIRAYGSEGSLSWGLKSLIGPRRLAPRPGMTPPTRSSQRINRLSSAVPNCVRYLEIGVQSGNTLENVRIRERIGVDPVAGFSTSKNPDLVTFFQVPSDDFFKMYQGEGFDITFVDGLHEWSQAYRDVVNAVNCLSDHGLVILDDCVPADANSANPDPDLAEVQRVRDSRLSPHWCGDVFRVLWVLQTYHSELDYGTAIDYRDDGTKYGQALIWRRGRGTTCKARDFSDVESSSIEGLRFEELFVGDSVPDFLRPANENEILDRYESALRTQI